MLRSAYRWELFGDVWPRCECVRVSVCSGGDSGVRTGGDMEHIKTPKVCSMILPGGGEGAWRGRGAGRVTWGGSSVGGWCPSLAATPPPPVTLVVGVLSCQGLVLLIRLYLVFRVNVEEGAATSCDVNSTSIMDSFLVPEAVV